MRPMLLAALALVTPAAVAAEVPQVTARPKLVVMLSVDQFSADLFRQYRSTFTGGLARIAGGAAFANGFQAHASTETCPGHSTLLTGAHPARSGIIANNWIDWRAPREDKEVYCAEDEHAPGATAESYTPSPAHLRVPTLGDRMKRANPASRVVAVAGKDRSAIMMGGHQADAMLYWRGGRFESLPGLTLPPVLEAVNGGVAAALATPREALTLPAHCTRYDRPIQVGERTVGTHRFARAAGDLAGFNASPEQDGATLAAAAALFQSMQLGRGEAPDLLAIGLAATDYVGHRYGTQGTEMCLQLASLDADLGAFLALLDRSGVPYAVALSADHGGLDLPERHRGVEPSAQRVERSALPAGIGAEVARTLRLAEPVFAGDWYLTPAVPEAQRARALAEATRLLRAHPQVEAVHTAAEVAAHPMPTGPAESWSLLDRFRAGFDPARSGDLLVAYKRYITPIVDPRGAVATHGSPWDYDRGVPILFWWQGIQPQDAPQSAMTVDIMPTLASLIGLPLLAEEIDGRCLDIIAGAGSNCR